MLLVLVVGTIVVIVGGAAVVSVIVVVIVGALSLSLFFFSFLLVETESINYQSIINRQFLVLDWLAIWLLVTYHALKYSKEIKIKQIY